MEGQGRLAEITRRHGIALIIQFGSTVDGVVHPKSDLDIAVLFDTVPGYDVLARVTSELQDIYPGREIDLAVLNRADPLFLKQVLDRCLLLSGSSRRFAELRIYAFKRYQDHRRYLEMERDHVRRTLGMA